MERLNRTTVRLPVTQAKLGMFVCRLDRPWLGTPFLMQGFLIQRTEELNQLRLLCDEICIDTHKSLVSISAPVSSNLEQTTHRIREESDHSLKKHRRKTVGDLRTVLPTYSTTLKSLQHCFNAFKSNLAICPDFVGQQVNGCLNSITQNMTAMEWLSRVKTHHTSTSEHAMHVSLLAMIFAINHGWTLDDTREAGVAGLLFDVGKLKIPQDLLQKPDRLTNAERRIVNNHPKWGRYYLEKSGFSKAVIDAAHSHHERPDGNGYSAQLTGYQTPLMARLIHILDAYCAMISPRLYRQPKTVFEAMQSLYKGRDTEFDGPLVDQFIAMTGVYPVGTIVELTSGEVAIVIGKNHDAQLLPKVSIALDQNKNPTEETMWNLKDLIDPTGRPLVQVKSMLPDGAYGIYMHNFTRQLLTNSIH